MVVVAGEEPVERVVQAGRLDLGQVAQLAEVDAEHRHARPRPPVATVRSMVPSPPRLTASRDPAAKRLVGDTVAFEAGQCRVGERQADHVAGVGQPAAQLAGRARGLGPLVVQHQPDRGHLSASRSAASCDRRRGLGHRPGDQVSDVGPGPCRPAVARRQGVDEELDVAVGTGDGRHHDAHDGGSAVVERGHHRPEHVAPDLAGRRTTPRPRAPLPARLRTAA